MRILVVDDDEGIREFVGWMLRDEGHEVESAANGALALRVLTDFHPHVILLDMRMPVMDGWQFMQAYRSNGVLRAPVIVVTAARDAAQRAREIGAEGHLGKPFDLDDLLQAVNRFEPKNGE